MIAIIDYGAGNIRSVINAVNALGYEAAITDDPVEVMRAQAVLLPGVGAGGDTMDSLRKLGIDEAVKQVIRADKPFLGICIGLQVLFSGTEEGGWHECLDIIQGRVKKFPGGLKVPHMGWNQVKKKIEHPVFKGIADNTNFYFVHSYYCVPEDQSAEAAETEYGINFCSAIIKGNLIAVQFHPEKSGEAGLKFYDNFLKFAGIEK
jgi:imidazole glycerol-phosphate synthase subunit HisH